MPRSLRLLAGLLSLVVAAMVSARTASVPDTGFIQVQCEPGIQIVLDGTLKDLSDRDQGGLVIEAVPVGERTVKALKPGFTPQERRVRVAKGEVAVVKFESLRPRPTVVQGGQEEEAPIVLKTGTVIVKSVPVECKVSIERADGAGGFDAVSEIDKVKPEATVSNLEIGQYRITAAWNKVTLAKTLDLTVDDEVTVFFNFVAKTVEVTSKVEPQRLADESAAKAAANPGLVVDLDGGVTMKFVAIEPGRFMMGSPEGKGENDERPQHEVTISKGFWLCQTEVTQAQWQAVMGSNPSRVQGDLTHPVEQVSWNDATEFCSRLSKKTGMEFRLPTEAEWEYACRTGTTTSWSFGDDEAVLGDYAWLGDNSKGSTKPVGTRKPNPWGLYDMHGNVWEWVSDWYGEYHYGPKVDPRGPSTGQYRVLRGGSWTSIGSSSCRSSGRDGITPVNVNGSVGFRAARTR